MTRPNPCRLVIFVLGAVFVLHAQAAFPAAKNGRHQLTHGHEDHAADNTQPFLAKGERYKRSTGAYTPPDVVLVNQDGTKVNFQAATNSGRPILLNFIFTTCTTICPPLAASFARFQEALGKEAAEVRLISVSIDPDHDTPAAMKKYLKRFGGQSGWQFLTGRSEDITQVMKAFDAYAVNKMNHYPLTFLRGPESDPWVRLYGLLGTSELVTEYRKVAGW